VRVQSYYDVAVRDNQGSFRDEMETYDIELQYSLRFAARNRFLFGGGYRQAEDLTTSQNVLLQFIPPRKTLKWSNIFVQQETALSKNVDLTLGAKWEDNVYTGTEFLPNIRLAWHPDKESLLWSAASRGVRAPARLDRDFYIPLLNINGGPNFQSEISDVVEIGYRAQPTPAFSYSLTAFHHWHENQRSGEPNPSGPGFVVSNTIDGRTKGVEGWAHYQAMPQWRLSGGFIQQSQKLRSEAGSLDPTGPTALGNDPERIWNLQSTYNIADNHQLFIAARYVSGLPNPRAPSYTAVDARYGWRLDKNLELSLNIQNLFDRAHSEFGNPATSSVYEQAFFLRLVWQE
jgi:iron complex outermembrane receptor protein